MDNRKEILYSDLPALVSDQSQLSTIRVLDKWETVTYETAKAAGTMLYAAPNVKPAPITLNLNLTGWYKVFVAMGVEGSFGTNYANLRFSNDVTYAQVSPDVCPPDHAAGVQEFYWRSVDLTGQTLEVSRFNTGIDQMTILAWLRFVPMSDEEVAAYKADMARKDTKRIYATHDMHGQLYLYDPEDINGWRSLVENFRDSDVKSLTMENITIYDGEPATGDWETLGYLREGDRNIQRGLKKKFTYELLNDLIAYGHNEVGIEMNLSMRMAAWGIQFPYDQMYFDNQFLRSHMDLRCVDRTGNYVEAASYAYPEVQEYILDRFSKMAATDCDGVEMIFNRVVATVLFEKPFMDRFAAKYPGVDPRELPSADKRVYTTRCEIMTEFVTKMRERLDRERAARGQKRINIIARVHATIYNSRINGFDVEEWAKCGLVDKIISYVMLINEKLDGDIWQDEDKSRIDVEKYRKFAHEGVIEVIWRRDQCEYQDHTLVPYGDEADPATDAERVAQWMELEKKYGTEIYFELLPRHMSTAEYKRRALALYEIGAERFSMWDTYNRVPVRSQWSMAGRLGHKDELKDFDTGEGVLFSHHRYLKVGGQNMSMYLPIWGG